MSNVPSARCISDRRDATQQDWTAMAKNLAATLNVRQLDNQIDKRTYDKVQRKLQSP